MLKVPIHPSAGLALLLLISTVPMCQRVLDGPQSSLDTVKKMCKRQTAVPGSDPSRDCFGRGQQDGIFGGGVFHRVSTTRKTFNIFHIFFATKSNLCMSGRYLHPQLAQLEGGGGVAGPPFRPSPHDDSQQTPWPTIWTEQA